MGLCGAQRRAVIRMAGANVRAWVVRAARLSHGQEILARPRSSACAAASVRRCCSCAAPALLLSCQRLPRRASGRPPGALSRRRVCQRARQPEGGARNAAAFASALAVINARAPSIFSALRVARVREPCVVASLRLCFFTPPLYYLSRLPGYLLE
jgi:hypothetical protein